MIHFLFPNAFFNPELLSWESSVRMKKFPWLKLWNIIFMEITGQNTHLCIQCNCFNIYMQMGNSNGYGPFLWCDLLGGFRPRLGQCMMTVSVPQAHSQHPERIPACCLSCTDIPPPHSTAANCSNSQRTSRGLLQAEPKACVLALAYFPNNTKRNNKTPCIPNIPNPWGHHLRRVKSLFFE